MHGHHAPPLVRLKRVLTPAVGLLLLAAACGSSGEPAGPRPVVSTSPSPTGSEEETPTIVVRLVAEEMRPSATLTWGDVVQDGVLGTHCWSRVTEDGGGVTGCMDYTQQTPEGYLEVPAGTVVAFEGDATEVSGSLGTIDEDESGWERFESNQQLQLDDGEDRIRLGPGEYVLDVFALFDQGDASFVFGVRVAPPEELASGDGGEEVLIRLAAGKRHPFGSLEVGDRVIDDALGTYCWAWGATDMCADAFGGPDEYLDVAVGASVVLDGDADDVSVAFLRPVSPPSDPSYELFQVLDLEEGPDRIALPPGEYTLSVTGRWTDVGEGNFIYGIRVV